MLFFYLLCYFLIYYGYVSNNPLVSCFTMILGLMLFSPSLVSILPVWMLYVFYMLFLTGILVIVFYFTSVGGMMHIFLPKFKIVVMLTFLLFPYIFSGVVGSSWFFVIFSLESLSLFLILLVFMMIVIVFSSFMLSCCGALRNM